MNGRGYDYNLGRFLSVDPIIQSPGNSQSLNPYSYIMNNPLAGTDPSGYMGCAASKIESVCAKTDANHGGSASPASSLVGSVSSGAGKGNGAQQNQPQTQVNQQNSAVDTGSQKNAAAAQGGNSNTNWNEKNDSQPLVESWVFESPLSQAQTWIFDNFINPIPDIEASINAAMDGDYSGALESMAGIVGKKVKAVGELSEKIADGATRITGYTKHGLNQAVGRDGGRGVKASEMLEAVRSPKKVIHQENGAVAYRGKNATVVLNEHGQVVTAFGKSRGPQIWEHGASPKIKPQGSGSAQRKANELGFSYLASQVR